MALLGRDTLVTGPLPKGALLLETFQGKETLGTPYRYDLTLLSDDPSIPSKKVLGQSLTVHLKLDTGDYRFFNGIVTSFSKTGISMHHTRYAVVLNPKLTLFDYTRDCRIFNDPTNFDPDPEVKKPTQDALKIVTEVLADRGLTDVESGSIKDHTYRDRRFCVQYRESDLNFIQRLLEEEGIYYFFKHEDGKHTLILADSATAHAKVPGYESILCLPKERKQAREEEHFWSLSVVDSLYPGTYTVLRGYDCTKVRAQQAQVEKKPSSKPQPGASFEDYDYPGGLSEEAQAKEEVQVRAQTDEAANTLIEVEGNTMGLGVGDLVTLRKSLSDAGYNPFWGEDDFGKEYLITQATYSISVDQYETGAAAEADEPFKATYTLLDSQTQFRPQRTSTKPRIEGPQTAIVVGSSGDEIYTDKLGRVKVQFDWDRLNDRNQKSSCWVRVAHVWAGKQWGAVHIPRVGQEVIVEFLDGDPDRPIITGRVYNADNMPPYALPDNKTQSGIKSRSSKGGSASNFNEIRFEDLKGKEELHIQAERDMSTNVKRNESLSVGGDRSVSVSGNQSMTISGGGQSPIHCSTKVTGKYDLDVSDTIHIKAPTSITLECPGSKIEMLPGKITLTAGDGAQIVLDANALTKSAAGAKTLHDANVLHQSVPGAKIVLDANALAQSVAGAKLLLDANVLAQSVPGSKVVLDASATMEGTASATVQGSSDATLTAGGGTVKTSAAGVEASGPKVDISGSGMVNIAGGIVKIN
jgi:type VI secretion system secreted protein VgrG